MEENLNSETLSEEVLEQEYVYFELIKSNLESNIERYGLQSRALLKSKEIEILFEGALLNFSIEHRGCSFRISHDGGIEYQYRRWTKLDLRRSLKLKALPMFFATCETDTLLESKK